jgi:Rps23 Pro-64 3,4-dihydroxylase Tpa1-like proline 4-hydroxylase
MIYYWTRLSYIPWHDDENHTGALTVYLNEEWDEDWGGYFLYKEDETIKAILPKKNFALLQQGGIKHATTPVHLNGGIRFTIQTFF